MTFTADYTDKSNIGLATIAYKQGGSVFVSWVEGVRVVERLLVHILRYNVCV